jgi:hypothetical protein
MTEPSLFDPKAPEKLKKTQLWFASIIEMPIDDNSKMAERSPSGDLMTEEAFDYILPSPKMHPAKRIEIYNQQYWWRLLSTLQDSVPLVTRLFGHYSFNQTIAIPYLSKFRPDSWSLNILGDHLPEWVETDYHEKDKQLVYDAALIDVALNQAFFTPHYPINLSKEAAENEENLNRKFKLQPHVFLFDLRYDLFSFREKMLDHEVEYWQENDFPTLVQDHRHYFVVYRNAQNNLKWEETSKTVLLILQKFKESCSIEQICEWLETQEDDIIEEASQKLHLFFQEWIFKQWLYVDE